MAEHQILGGKHFLILGPKSGKIWWLKKVQYLQKKCHCQWTVLRGEKPEWIFHNLGNLLRPLELKASRERVDPAEWQERTVLGDCIPRAKVIPAPAPQYRQHALISGFLDLAHPRLREEAALATELDQGPTGRVEVTEPYVGHQDGPIYRQFTSNLTAEVHYAILHGNPWAIARDFSPFLTVLPRHFLPNVHLKAPSVTILTSWRPAVNPLPSCSSRKPVQDQSA